MAEWIKCKDKLPEQERMVIVACYGSDIVIPREGETVHQTRERLNREVNRVDVGFIGSDGWYSSDGFPMIIAPTYWQPLPEAPEYEPDPDDKDTGMTWEEMHERGKARAEKLASKIYTGKDGIKRTWSEAFEAIFNDEEGET